jgi:hypothetical protein
MMFPFHSLDSFGSALASKSNDPEEDYHFHKQLGQVSNNFIVNNLFLDLKSQWFKSLNYFR